MSLFISIIYYTMYIPELTKIIYYINIYIWRKIYFNWHFLWYIIKETVKKPQNRHLPACVVASEGPSSPVEHLRGWWVVPHPAAHAATATWLQDDGEMEQTLRFFSWPPRLFTVTSPCVPA